MTTDGKPEEQQPGQQPDAAKKFLNYLDSPEAGDIFKRFGFLLRD